MASRSADGAVCRWCGREQSALRCARCGSDAVRAVVVGARRTAEELGRAFPGTTVVTSGGDNMVATVPEKHTAGLCDGMHTFKLPVPVEDFTISLFWHPRLDADPAHRWLRSLVLEICKGRR